MADDPEIVDATDVAVRKALEVYEVPKPIDGKCLDCPYPATMSDGRCDAHTRMMYTPRGAARRARQIMDLSLPKYAELHRRAAEQAASKGDGRPAEWALERGGVVEAVDKTGGGPRVVVQVGVVLPGLKENT